MEEEKIEGFSDTTEKVTEEVEEEKETADENLVGRTRFIRVMDRDLKLKSLPIVAYSEVWQYVVDRVYKNEEIRPLLNEYLGETESEEGLTMDRVVQDMGSLLGEVPKVIAGFMALVFSYHNKGITEDLMLHMTEAQVVKVLEELGKQSVMNFLFRRLKGAGIIGGMRLVHPGDGKE